MSVFHDILNMIEDIKENLTDNNYKNIVDKISECKTEYEEIKTKENIKYSVLFRKYVELNDKMKLYDKLKDDYINLSTRYLEYEKKENGEIRQHEFTNMTPYIIDIDIVEDNNNDNINL